MIATTCKRFTGKEACIYSKVAVCNFSCLIEASLFTVHSPTVVSVLYLLLLMQSQHFLLLLLHVNSIQLAFIVKQSQEMHCICHYG